MFRRHPILTLFALLVTAGLLTIVVFLATFDLNRYREELQARLSSALSQPVRLGTADLSLQPGPTFDFTTIEIGNPDQPLLQADQLSLKTKLLPLLIGKLSFAEIVLHRPDLRLSRAPAGDNAPDQPSSTLVLHRLLSTVRVHSLQIIDGSLQLTDLGDRNTPLQLHLTSIDLRARHIYSRRKGRLQLSSYLEEGPGSRLQASGHLALPTDPDRWRQLWLDLTISLQDLAPGNLCRHYLSRIGCSGTSGQLDAHLALKGSPAQGLHFTSELQGDKLRLQPAGLYPQPLPLQTARLSGRWTATAELDKLDELALQLDELHLAGHLSLQRGDTSPWLEGGLTTPDLPLAAITRLLPSDAPPLNLLPQGQPPSGTLRLAYSRFAGPLSQFRQQTLPQIVKEATVYLRDGRFRFGKGPLFEEVTATATWQAQRLTLTDGTAVVLDSPLQFSGAVARPFQADADITLGAGWVLPGRNLSRLHAAPLLQSVAAQGPIPLSINMSGKISSLQWKMQADLEACNLGYRQLLTKPTGMAGGIKLQGELTADELRLTDSHLWLGPLQLTLSGHYARTAAQDYTLQLSLTDTDLGRFQSLAPALKDFQLRGKLAGHYRLQGAGRTVRDGAGQLQVAGLGLHFPAVVGGDLQHLQGTLALQRDRIEWQPLRGLLGRSPVAVGGRIDTGPQPRLELHITAKQLQADELIFSSPSSRLHDLDGRLVFAGNRAAFNDVRVTLDGGSKVIVNGHHQGGPQPETILTATSERADVDQVVALWQGPKKPHQPESEQNYRVVVLADVAQGTYQQLQFQSAKATITATPGLVRIAPLNFATGGGHCLAQIAVQQTTDRAQRLVVSGQVSGVEAETLQYGKILDQEGLLSGALDGNFFLQGELGENFLPTADGGFEIQVKDGMLRKFAFLSKVFSLLNVSQLLTLHLPDMVKEGMPFSILQGNLVLRDGALSTEDLFITSNAMNLSLVGDIDLAKERLDLLLGVKPFRTVDKVITRIPIAGWLLAGDEKALVTAHFEIKGPSNEPTVKAIPVSSISGKVLGIFKRVLGLPGKLITDPTQVITGQPGEVAPQAP